MDTFSAFASRVSYSIRPRVHEVGFGEFRGCADVIGRQGAHAFSFARFCDMVRSGRDRAELDALRLAQHLQDTECRHGKSWILPGQVSVRCEPELVLDVPSSLLRRIKGGPSKRHLKVAA
ncbi:hypothetical protein [Bordetella sp. BOR01]|uniref:hypothetical protein n=1 Tax=Bordetella sp. BOR01 TaxID=2854779 RepID=UPI001C494B5B|nr:hypothetical protein [Bordetella sp. BOR01]MBV7485721.1 hypothetical protein [Bordetella sp. BOR01]